MQKDPVSSGTIGCWNISILHWSLHGGVRNGEPSLTCSTSFFPLGLGIKALWTGFCSYSVSLCKSPFRRPVCSSNFGIRKSDLNQTNSHLPSAFQPYHLLILCSNSLSLYKHHSPFLCFPLWSNLAIQQGPFKPHLSRETSGLCLSSPLSQSCPILSAYSAFC